MKKAERTYYLKNILDLRPNMKIVIDDGVPQDENGNYLWNAANDTILGKPVYISNAMPDIGSGKKPIAFGDFSYYWIVDRESACVRCLRERFAVYQQTGYLATEFLDAKLIRPDAVKVLQIAADEEE